MVSAVISNRWIYNHTGGSPAPVESLRSAPLRPIAETFANTLTCISLSLSLSLLHFISLIRFVSTPPSYHIHLSKHDSSADGNNGGRHDTGRATYRGSRAGAGEDGAIVPIFQRYAITKGNLLVGAPIIWKWNAKETYQ